MLSLTMKVTEKTGAVVGALRVNEDDDVMLMTSAGQSVRIRAASIRVIGRATQGVKLMNLDEGDAVVDVARVIVDDENGNGGSNGDDEVPDQPEDEVGDETDE